MGKDDLVKKLEEELKKAVPKSHPVIDRAVIIGYLARLTQKELDDLFNPRNYIGKSEDIIDNVIKSIKKKA